MTFYHLNFQRFKGCTINTKSSSPKTGEESLIQRIEQLEHELAYTRQEVEFLKKIQEAGMEEQKVWESKRLRK